MELRSRNNKKAKNSHHLCFFCKRNGSENASSDIKLSISNILSYLQITLREVLKGKGKEPVYDSSDDPSLSLCEHCSQIAVEFNELYRLLEETEQRLNRCLSRMQEVMTKAEPDTPNDKKDDLRTAMMGRIKEIGKVPRRTQIGPTFSSAKDSKRPKKTASASDLFPEESSGSMSVPSPPESDSETEIGSEEEVKRSTREGNKKRKRTRTPTKSDFLPSASPQSTASKKKGRGGNRTCKFCGKAFTRFTAAQRHMKYNCEKGERLPPPDAGLLLSCAYCSYESANNRRDHMNNHLIRCHPEMFFQSERDNPSLSSPWKKEHFKSILKNIALPKFILRNSSSPSSSCSCSVCGKMYCWRKRFADNSSELTIHLINNHIQEIREHLKDVMGQSDAWLQKKISNAISTTERSGKRRSSTSKENTIMDVDDSGSSGDNDEDNA